MKDIKEEILFSLWRISEQTGEVITEYHWRELCGIIDQLKTMWKISDDKLIEIVKSGYGNVHGEPINMPYEGSDY